MRLTSSLVVIKIMRSANCVADRASANLFQNGQKPCETVSLTGRKKVPEKVSLRSDCRFGRETIVLFESL